MGRMYTGLSVWLLGLTAASIAALGVSVACAQTNPPQTNPPQTNPPQTNPPQITRSAGNKTAVVTSGTGQYYFEFRARQAWDYGHTFVVFGRVGEAPRKNNVAGLSPKGDDPAMWVMGHYVPVPSDTGWTDGDLEDKYITARYRVLVSKEQYDRTVAFIRQLQARSTTWSVEMYNCNAFVADIANFMGLKAPSSTWIYPKVFVTNMRKINTGHPEAANELVSENVKEMNSPTRDGRAMIAGGLIAPNSAPTAGSASAPHVTIGAVRVTNRPANSSGSAQHTP